jgi:DNA-binding NarL/FixJ family response regulator
MDDVRAIRLIVADDQPLIRKALASALSLERDMAIVASVGDGAEAVRAARAFRPDVVLMDLKMPMLDGIAATRAIVAERLGVHVIVLTTFDQDEMVYEAILAGADAYLLKEAREAEIVEAIRAAARGEPRLSPSVAAKILGEFRRVKGAERTGPVLAEDLLTERERDVLAGVASGKANRDIARELSLAEGTVKNHVSTILSKLHLRSRTELAVRAVSGR